MHNTFRQYICFRLVTFLKDKCARHKRLSSSHGKVLSLCMVQSRYVLLWLDNKKNNQRLNKEPEKQFHWPSTQTFLKANNAPLCSTLTMTSALQTPEQQRNKPIKYILYELVPPLYTCTHLAASLCSSTENFDMKIVLFCFYRILLLLRLFFWFFNQWKWT